MRNPLSRLLALCLTLAGALVTVSPGATASVNDQVLKASIFFDLNGNHVYDSLTEDIHPPTAAFDFQSDWTAAVWLYKVNDDNQILATSWVPFGAQWGEVSSAPLSPGRWIAVLDNVNEGLTDTHPAWAGQQVVQSLPLSNQAIEFTIEPDQGASIRFGISLPDPTHVSTAPISGPSFAIVDDANYNQSPDVGEVPIADGYEFTWTAVHNGPHTTQTATTSGGTVHFGIDARIGAHILATSDARILGTPWDWVTGWWSESVPQGLQYLVAPVVNDDCDQDPGDGITTVCLFWPTPARAMAYQPATDTLTATAWFDVDGDGVRDAGEPAPPSGLSVATLSREQYGDTSLWPNPFRWPSMSGPIAADGSFSLGPVPAGSFDLTATPGRWAALPQVTVTSSGSTPTNLGLVPGAGPVKVASLKATSTRRAVTLKWVPGAVGTTRGYPSEFYVRQLIGGNKKLISVTTGSRRSMVVKNLRPRTKYTFSVTARNLISPSQAVAVTVRTKK